MDQTTNTIQGEFGRIFMEVVDGNVIILADLYLMQAPRQHVCKLKILPTLGSTHIKTGWDFDTYL